jgi:uncharacterized protein YndB with AHSA1/START domain
MTSLTIVRRIKARPSILFDAMTTREGIAHWWCPDDGPVLFSQVDPRVGGAFRVRFRLTSGSEHECHGTYLEFVPHERYAASWRWMDDAQDAAASRVEVNFRPIPEGTELTVTHLQLKDDESRRIHEEGWIASLAKLERYAAAQ